MKIKVGVIGLGFMGSAHARIYNQIEDCELVAICDINPEKKEVADLYSCDFFTDYDCFFKQNIDAISVCTPTSIHKEITIQALETGKHVLVEKPFTDSVKNGIEMKNKASKLNLILAIGYIERFNSAVKKLKEVIDWSNIFSTVSMRFGPFPPRTKYSGVFLDLASHEIDILNYLTKKKPNFLYSHFSTKINNKFEDYVYISLNYGHIHSHIEASWLPNYKLRNINLYGDQKFYLLNYAQQKLKCYRGPPKAKIENGSWNDILWLTRHVGEEVQISSKEPLALELKCFIDSIKNNKIIDPLCKPDEALEVLKIFDKVFKNKK